MKSLKVILIVLMSSFYLLAQKDSTQLKKGELISTDSSKRTLPLTLTLPPRALIIKMKDLKEIKNLDKSLFRIIDDTSHYTAEELSSGLSEEELANYKENKEKIKQFLLPSPSEAETYPTISTIRKILSIAKTAGVIIVLILSLL